MLPLMMVMMRAASTALLRSDHALKDEFYAAANDDDSEANMRAASTALLKSDYALMSISDDIVCGD